MLDLPIAFEVTHWMPLPLPPNAKDQRHGEVNHG
jgi:hypothetical protein